MMNHQFAEPILRTLLEDDATSTGGTAYVGETVEDFIREDPELLHSMYKVSELNTFLVESGIKPIQHDYKCGGCCRFEERDMRPDETGYHCTMQDYHHDVIPDEEACFWYWDRAEQERIDHAEAEEREAERLRKWSIYAEKPPVKLPIVYDGYGYMPMCPVCGDMPYSTEQCHWCGQRFLQDEEVEEYNIPSPEETILCIACGKKTMTGSRSKYNGHFHGKCTNCGAIMME